MEVCLNFPQKRESIQSSADETLSAHESTTNCLQSNDPDDQDHLMLIQLQQDSPHGSY
jgi:cellobiose-specific phosphotransferase system component IIA